MFRDIFFMSLDKSIFEKISSLAKEMKFYVICHPFFLFLGHLVAWYFCLRHLKWNSDTLSHFCLTEELCEEDL